MQQDGIQSYDYDGYAGPGPDSIHYYVPAQSAYNHDNVDHQSSFHQPNNMLPPYYNQHGDMMQSYYDPTPDVAAAFSSADDSNNIDTSHNILTDNAHNHSLRSMAASQLPTTHVNQEHKTPHSRQRASKATEPITLPDTGTIVHAGPSNGKGTRPIDALPFTTTKSGDFVLMCGNDHILPELHVSCSKNMQIMEQEPKLVCYRRNYVTVDCSYRLPIPAHRQGDYLSGFKDKVLEVADKNGQRWIVKALGINMIGTIDGFNGKEVSLVKYEPTRDLGRKYAVNPVPCLPDQSDMPQYNRHNAATAMPNLPFQSVNPGEPLTTRHMFERIQFRQATSNNGQRRASQQFFHIEIQIVADVATVVNRDDAGVRHAGHWMVLKSLMSEGLVVRGRSPSHYMKNPADIHLLPEPSRKLNKKKKRRSSSKHVNEDGDVTDEDTEDADELALAQEAWKMDPETGLRYIYHPSGAKKEEKQRQEKLEAEQRAAVGLPPLPPKSKGAKKVNIKKTTKRPQKSTATDKNTAKKETARVRAYTFDDQVSDKYPSYSRSLHDGNAAADVDIGAAIAPVMPLYPSTHGIDYNGFINYEPNLLDHDSSNASSSTTDSPGSEYAQLDDSDDHFLHNLNYTQAGPSMKLVDDDIMLPSTHGSYLRTQPKVSQPSHVENCYHHDASSMHWN
jgi:hypothetical protein